MKFFGMPVEEFKSEKVAGRTVAHFRIAGTRYRNVPMTSEGFTQQSIPARLQGRLEPVPYPWGAFPTVFPTGDRGPLTMSQAEKDVLTMELAAARKLIGALEARVAALESGESAETAFSRFRRILTNGQERT